MKILIINVSLRPTSNEKIFPIGLGYIATAIKNAGYSFDLLDIDLYRYSQEYVERYLKDNHYDVVCMGCIVTGYKIVKNYAAIIRAAHPETKIIVGNSVASSIIDTLLTRTAVDCAVIGEGEVAIVEILEALAKGRTLKDVKGVAFLLDRKVFKTAARTPIENISLIPPVDFSIFDVDKYIECSKINACEPLPIPREQVRALPVNTARGCVANCGFCYHVFKGVPYRYRSAESVVSEIKSLVNQYGLNYVFFWDELTFFSKKHTLDLVDKFIEEKLPVYWTGCCRSNLFDCDDDVEIIQRMKTAGCIGMIYSLESADEKILEAMNKKVKVEHFSRQSELFHKAGLTPWTSLVIGYPQETPQTIRKTFDCCIQNRIYPSVGYLLPQPGSPVYDYARQNGFIPDEEEYLLLMGDRQDLRLNMTTMSDEELQTEVLEGLKRCNRELGVGLDESKLVKTQHFRSKKKSLT
ncbi:MAG: radical SAM protein [Candidatus Omnitrophota bacterium]